MDVRAFGMSMMDILGTAAALTDEALIARIKQLAGRERVATVELVAHLAELETRQVVVTEGYSLFTYCTRVLRLAEHSAYNRIEVARTARRFPVVLDLLADGSLSLSTARLLAPHLTEANHRAVLAEASGKSKREVEMLVARLAPRADVPATIRKLPVVAVAAPAPTAVAAPASTTVSISGVWAPATVVDRPGSRPVVESLAPERYRLQVTVGRAGHDALRELQELLCREIPDGDAAQIVERALSALLADVRRQKAAEVDHPRTRTRPGASSRHIPASVKRAVRKRDGGQCAYVGKHGHRCTERRFLEFHHIWPWAKGGPSTVENMALRCRRHNVYESGVVFGPYRAAPRRERAAQPPRELSP
jgi:5-methylcytosine-specific restriction endonuclease McrA